MSQTNAQRKANARYKAKNMEQIKIWATKGTKSKIQQLSISSGESMAGYILTAIKERAEREGMAWDNIGAEGKTADNQDNIDEQDNTSEKDNNQATSGTLYPIGYKVEG